MKYKYTGIRGIGVCEHGEIGFYARGKKCKWEKRYGCRFGGEHIAVREKEGKYV